MNPRRILVGWGDGVLALLLPFVALGASAVEFRHHT